MATSRTGTSKYLRNRATILRQAQRDGITTCPNCGTHLNYDEPHQPNSAEADHIIPHSRGGTDDTTNLTVLCRWCNSRKSNGRRKTQPPQRRAPATTHHW